MLSACQDEELRVGVSGVTGPRCFGLEPGKWDHHVQGVPGLGRMFDPFFWAVSCVGRYLGRDHPRGVTLDLSILYPPECASVSTVGLVSSNREPSSVGVS